MLVAVGCCCCCCAGCCCCRSCWLLLLSAGCAPISCIVGGSLLLWIACMSLFHALAVIHQCVEQLCGFIVVGRLCDCWFVFLCRLLWVLGCCGKVSDGFKCAQWSFFLRQVSWCCCSHSYFLAPLHFIVTGVLNAANLVI